jgi:hypothetical protein
MNDCPTTFRIMPALLLALSIFGCCAPKPPAAITPVQTVTTDFDPNTTGPTIKSRVSGGYELLNKQFRLVISDQTGDVIFWGYADKTRNIVFHRGIFTTLSALPAVPVKGSIEQRDDDTLQFMGEDENQITWRKIYRLAGDHVEASVMIQNNRPAALDTAINLNGDLPDLRIMKHEPEEFDAFGGYGTVALRGFNEVHHPTSQPVLPILLQSDVFHLKPGERQSFSSMWMLSE